LNNDYLVQLQRVLQGTERCHGQRELWKVVSRGFMGALAAHGRNFLTPRECEILSSYCCESPAAAALAKKVAASAGRNWDPVHPGMVVNLLGTLGAGPEVRELARKGLADRYAAHKGTPDGWDTLEALIDGWVDTYGTPENLE